MKMRQMTKGFTLIELVIVITIIAILAALALPRFAALQSQARIAKAQALTGAIRAAGAIAKAACLADMAVDAVPTCTAAAGTVLMENVAITMVDEYPAANVNVAAPFGILTAAQLSAANDGITVALAGTTVNVDINGGTAPNCRVAYTAPAALGGSPTVTVTTTGC